MSIFCRCDLKEIDAKAEAKGVNKSEYLIGLIKNDQGNDSKESLSNTIEDVKGLSEEFTEFNKQWLSFKKQYEYSKGLILNNYFKLKEEVKRLSAIIEPDDKLLDEQKKEVDEEVDSQPTA